MVIFAKDVALENKVQENSPEDIAMTGEDDDYEEEVEQSPETPTKTRKQPVR